jgi:hypothetical protein
VRTISSRSLKHLISTGMTCARTVRPRCGCGCGACHVLCAVTLHVDVLHVARGALACTWSAQASHEHIAHTLTRAQVTTVRPPARPPARSARVERSGIGVACCMGRCGALHAVAGDLLLGTGCPVHGCIGCIGAVLCTVALVALGLSCARLHGCKVARLHLLLERRQRLGPCADDRVDAFHRRTSHLHPQSACMRACARALLLLLLLCVCARARVCVCVSV